MVLKTWDPFLKTEHSIQKSQEKNSEEIVSYLRHETKRLVKEKKKTQNLTQIKGKKMKCETDQKLNVPKFRGSLKIGCSTLTSH